jgi:hypothetical protein
MDAPLRTIVLWLAGFALVAYAVVAGFARLDRAEQAAERRSLMARDAVLDRVALQPGSALSCLDAGAGETVENDCEQRVFATAQSTAAAVTYMSARLTLLADAVKAGDARALTATRRAVALDRFGVAAHVLATRDGCTPKKCDAFDLVHDASVLKANLKAEVFDQYVSRYEPNWNAPAAPAASAPAAKPPAVSALPPPAVASSAPVVGQRPMAPVKPGEHWDFPSAASIPPVSIMNTEPPLPKGADARAQAQNQTPAPSQTQTSPAIANPPLPPPHPAAPPAAPR